jgi:hypothetical protein
MSVSCIIDLEGASVVNLGIVQDSLYILETQGDTSFSACYFICYSDENEAFFSHRKEKNLFSHSLRHISQSPY